MEHPDVVWVASAGGQSPDLVSVLTVPSVAMDTVGGDVDCRVVGLGL